MEKIDIYAYRSSKIESHKMMEFDNVDTDCIIELLTTRGLVQKRDGLCAPPWDKYFSISYKDSRGVSHSGVRNVNYFHIIVNQATSTYSKKKSYAWIDIVKTETDYYVVAIAQSSRYHDSSGAETIVYKCQKNELNDVLDILYKNIK